MNVRPLALAGIPALFASGAVAARIVLGNAPRALARDLAQPLIVVTAWGNYGAACFAILAVCVLGTTLLALVAALARNAPDSRRGTVAVLTTVALALAACLAWPFIFSSDVYAYAAYGDMARQGLDPYRIVPAAAHDPFVDAARVQWSGVFPVCVYGPLFVGAARLAATGGAAYGVAATLLGLRAAACAAFLASVALLCAALEGVTPRQKWLALCAYGLNPTLIWSAAEGHNDAYLALVACAAAVLVRSSCSLTAVLLLALTPVWKASGTVLAVAAALHAAFIARLGSGRTLTALGAGTGIAVGIALPPLLPALATVGARGTYEPASLQGLIGLWPALVLAGAAAIFALAAFSRQRSEGFAWFGIAVVVALPNVYPWYGLWLAPLALAAGGGFAAAALWGATISSALRYLPDATGGPAGIARLAAALGALPLALAFGRFASSNKKAPFLP
ncbi:MAG: hypothetical protein M3R53_05445 [Candidatus Eremiobacteraeota bacterium]|nr:hypothetical protein [Candidatus Eremiobacteraeota bacterium]